MTQDLKSYLSHLDAIIARSRRIHEGMIYVEVDKIAAVVAALRHYADQPVRVPARTKEVAG